MSLVEGGAMKIPEKRAIGSAHGKIILIGEHSVVHHQPAIAIPFTSAEVEVVIEEIPGETILESLYYQGKLEDAPDSLHNLIQTLDAVCFYLGTSTRNLHIRIQSQIPAERGMGSSAAVATALVRALFHFFEKELSNDLLKEFVAISEEIAHGNPSGLDATVVQSEQAVYFMRDQQPEYFDNSLPAYLVIADTGDKGETIHAVADVNKLVADGRTNGRQLVEQLGLLTVQARELIEQKKIHALGRVLSKAQKHLKELTVSNEKLDELIEVAMDNGALGAKLTGGGRGGCMIALMDRIDDAEKLADTLIEAGAAKTWIHPLGVKIYGK